jgi:2-polyprenyl-3-methyl-5-hydroxy-6-metoxy-1,4-benzoquinol methylase
VTGLGTELDVAASARGCRGCHGRLGAPVLDLGPQPLIDDPVPADVAGRVPQAPVIVLICERCGLVQLDPDSVPDPPATDDGLGGILANSTHGHARRRPGALADHQAAWAQRVLRHTRLPPGSLVTDVASGDGAVLDQYRDAGMTVLGHESRGALVAAAEVMGIATVTDDFAAPEAVRRIAARGGADLILINHALSHADDVEAVLAAVAEAVKADGWVAIEFLDLASVLGRGHFDIFCHAHRSYLSLTTLEHLLARHGLVVTAAHRSTVHGGSLQLLVRRAGSGVTRSVAAPRLLTRDAAVGVTDPAVFGRLGDRARIAGRRLREHLGVARTAGTTVVGYGAPGRAVALLAIAHVGEDLLPFTVDRDPEKQGLSLPGSAVPIRAAGAIYDVRPDEVMVLAWTWAAEVARQLAHGGEWGGRLVVPLPRLRTLTRREERRA